jgi:hypothetical protein
MPSRPVSGLGQLSACAGNWRGTNRLQDPEANAPVDSPSTATVARVLGGRFIRVDYTWAYRGAPQEGSLLIGHDKKANVATAHWIDTWHMGAKVMACQGSADDTGTISVRGSYAVPPGPNWGWRTVVTPNPGRSLRIVMHNIWPDGREELAVDATYTKAARRVAPPRRRSAKKRA